MRFLAICSVLMLVLSAIVSANIADFAMVDNALLVIGEDAKADDVISSVGLATGLYSASPEVSPLAELINSGEIKFPDGLDNTVYVLGDVVRLSGSGDKLEAAEKIGNVKPVIDGSDSPSLAEGIIRTDRGTTKYNQYLKFETGSNTAAADYVASGSAQLKTDDDDQVNVYLEFAEDTRMFEYDLLFEEGLKSEIECTSSSSCTTADSRRLTDFEGLELNILGSVFTIVKARVDSADDTVTLNLVGDGMTVLMEEGETQTLTLGDEEVEISVTIISDSDNKAKFTINGLMTNEFTPGKTESIGNDLYIGVSEILSNEAGEPGLGDMVQFVIGRNMIEFYDTNYTDTTAQTNIKIRGNTVVGSELELRATEPDDNTFRLNLIKYRLKAKSDDHGTVYVPAGDSLRNNLKYPEGLLTDNWDIYYFGAAPDMFMYGKQIRFMPHGDDSYKLTFTNNEDLVYTFPLVDNSNNDGKGFKYGSDDNQLRYFECSSSTDFCIEKNDYIVVTEAKTGYASGSPASNTRIIKFDSVDTSSKIVNFQDLATGEFSAVYTGTEGSGATGEVSIGGKGYTFYVGADPYNISMDMNDDSDVGDDRSDITVKGGGIMKIGSNQTADQTGGLDTLYITITTPANRFDENGILNLGVPEVAYLTVSEQSSNKVDMNIYETATGFAKYSFPDTDAYFASTPYGIAGYEGDDTGNSDYIKLTYPEVQAQAQAYVTFGHFEVIPLSLIPMLGPVPLETFLDEANTEMLLGRAQGALNAMSVGIMSSYLPLQRPLTGETAKIDTDVSEGMLKVAETVVLVGGPCVNDYVAALAEQGLTHTCEDWLTLEETGMLQYLVTDFGPTYIVAGNNGEDTQRAAFILENLDVYAKDIGDKDQVYFKGMVGLD